MAWSLQESSLVIRNHLSSISLEAGELSTQQRLTQDEVFHVLKDATRAASIVSGESQAKQLVVFEVLN